MSLSYSELELGRPRSAPAAGTAKGRSKFSALCKELGEGIREVTASPHFAPVMLRVTSALALGFVLVRLMKTYIA